MRVGGLAISIRGRRLPKWPGGGHLLRSVRERFPDCREVRCNLEGGFTKCFSICEASPHIIRFWSLHESDASIPSQFQHISGSFRAVLHHIPDQRMGKWLGLHGFHHKPISSLFKARADSFSWRTGKHYPESISFPFR